LKRQQTSASISRSMRKPNRVTNSRSRSMMRCIVAHSSSLCRHMRSLGKSSRLSLPQAVISSTYPAASYGRFRQSI
jgi:hypothetical protein